MRNPAQEGIDAAKRDARIKPPATFTETEILDALARVSGHAPEGLDASAWSVILSTLAGKPGDWADRRLGTDRRAPARGGERRGRRAK